MDLDKRIPAILLVNSLKIYSKVVRISVFPT